MAAPVSHSHRTKTTTDSFVPFLSSVTSKVNVIYQRPEALNPPIQSNSPCYVVQVRFLLLRQHSSKTRLRFQLSKVSIFLFFGKFTVLFLSIVESSFSAIQGQSVIFNLGGNWADERVQTDRVVEGKRSSRRSCPVD